MQSHRSTLRDERRAFLTSAGSGLGSLALASMLNAESSKDPAHGADAALHPLTPRPPHFAPKAKNCVFIFLMGGMSQFDLFDPKPKLNELSGKPLPASITEKVRFSFLEKATATIMGTPRKFQRHGQCGLELSDLLPHLATCADDIALVRSMHTDSFNHSPAELLLFTGAQFLGRPALGAWLTYGLGSVAQNLPGYVVLSCGRHPQPMPYNWASGFLPPSYQGVVFRNQGEAVLNLRNPPGVSAAAQKSQLDAIADLNQQRYQQIRDPQIAARIASYELAFKMQSAAPELVDLAGESRRTLDDYGLNREEPPELKKHSARGGGAGVYRAFANNCLLARRLVERGVRFVTVAHTSWDQHDNLDGELEFNCRMADQPIAALLKDLKQRGLLETTLVVCASEFGRTPLGENRKTFKQTTGRDHHPFSYSLWLAGAGVRAGHTIGKTDDYGWNVVEDPIHVNDLQATLLHLFGLDHKRLTYRYQGRDFRLTDVAGKVVGKLLA